MVFGVFDGLHEGHQYFLTQAATYGSLIVVVAPDLAVQHLKHKKPKHSQDERLAAVREFMPEAIVVLGDERQGTYEVVKTHRPAMILLGHDQRALGDDVRRAMASGALPDIPCRSLPQKPA